MEELMGRAGCETAKAGSAWKYNTLAYAFAWIPWIICIKLHAPETLLSLGSAGPGVAALLLLGQSGGPARRITARRVLLFLLTAVGCSVVLSLYYQGRTAFLLHFQWQAWSLIPSIVPAWILACALSPGGSPADELSASLFRFSRWSLVGLLIFPAIILAGDALARQLHQPLTNPGGDGSAADRTAQVAVIFLYNFILVAVLEEPGWRGYLLPALQRRWSPLWSTLVVWLAWAFWHLPLDLSRPVRFSFIQYLEIRVVFLIPIAIILTWLYNRSHGSLQGCAMFHASMNTFPMVLPYWMPSFALLFVLAGAAVVRGRMWRKDVKVEPALVAQK